MSHTPFILPLGTQVVSRVDIRGTHGRPIHPAGVVGVITAAPADHLHAYRVRFPDGFEAALRRDELTPLHEFQSWNASGTAAGNANLLIGSCSANGVTANPNIAVPAAPDLRPYIIFQCVIGSRAYGLDHADSDTDRRGIYLPPADVHWSLFGIAEQLEFKDTEECYWELQKFLVLALKANPNVLECLYSPLVEKTTPLADELLAMRDAFLSKLAYQTYNGYVMSQFKKLSADIRNQGAVKWKHVMHLLRLLLAGITLLREARVPVRVEDPYRDKLLAIKRGEVKWEEANAWRLQLHEQFDAALTSSALPERPNYERVNAFLLKARRSVVADAARSSDIFFPHRLPPLV